MLRGIYGDPDRYVRTYWNKWGPGVYVTGDGAKRDADGNYLLGLDYPSYFPFMENARREEPRRRYYVAKLSEGGAQNLDQLYEIFKLRQELAGLYGLPSYAQYALRRRMVETPEVVNRFLADVKTEKTDAKEKK